MSLMTRLLATLGSVRALFVTAVLAGSLTGLGFLGVADTHHIVTARFRDADGLVVGNEVRVAGVSAGSVQAITVAVDPATHRQYAQVDMDVDAKQWPLHEGTTIAVKPKGVLSNVFVDMQPGPVAGPSLGDHPFFGLDHTQSPVNLDELANVFDPSVRESIRTQLQEGVLALAANGAFDLNQTILYSDPLTRDAIPLTAVLAARSPQLDRLNFEFDTISGDLAREDANLRPLIVNLNTTLGALAARETDLQGTLLHAADVFTELDHALAGVTAPDPKNENSQSDLARFFAHGTQALSCAAAVSTYFTPLIRQVNPHVVSLDALLGEFVTATGYNANTQNSNDALRIDPTLPPSGYTYQANGGLSREHGGSYAQQAPLQFPAAFTVPGFTSSCPNGAGLAIP
jgi:ABC-type transporter Mla subunit MlaD